jgi:hypothetical protein
MRRPHFAIATLALLLSADTSWSQAPATPTNELDSFMAQVLARRDDNWTKLQQYILDELERAEFRGPGEALLWGEKHEYVWYLRDGFFVRSPVRFNGVTIGERDREKYELDFLRRARERDSRGKDQDGTAAAASAAPSDVQSFIQQTREPQFVSSAYFLQFKFEGGRYGLVGREKIDGRDVLRIEYYPTKLFSEDPKTRAEARGNQATGRKDKDKEDAFGDEVQRLMNKGSLVTIWVEPNQKQIVKYTFDNVGLDFLPAAWLVRVTDLKASMLMSEAFPGVWLPKRVDAAAAIVLAPGPFSVSYDIQYSGYREAATSSKYGGVSGR